MRMRTDVREGGRHVISNYYPSTATYINLFRRGQAVLERPSNHKKEGGGKRVKKDCML